VAHPVNKGRSGEIQTRFKTPDVLRVYVLARPELVLKVKRGHSSFVSRWHTSQRRNNGQYIVQFRQISERTCQRFLPQPV